MNKTKSQRRQRACTGCVDWKRSQMAGISYWSDVQNPTRTKLTSVAAVPGWYSSCNRSVITLLHLELDWIHSAYLQCCRIEIVDTSVVWSWFAWAWFHSGSCQRWLKDLKVWRWYSRAPRSLQLWPILSYVLSSAPHCRPRTKIGRCRVDLQKWSKAWSGLINVNETRSNAR